VSTKKGAVAMIKLAVRYTRYAVSMLASMGFLVSYN
jgi:hypothetical protein